MKWLETLLFIWLSFTAKVLGFGIFIGVFVLAYTVDKGVQNGSVVSIFETGMLLAVSFYLLWVSIRLMMLGNELSKKY